MAERQYKLLEEQECCDVLVLTYLSNERDHYQHSKNSERYALMLQTLPASPFRDRIQSLLAETQVRLLEVESILDATTPQLPTPAIMQAAMTRLKAQGKISG